MMGGCCLLVPVQECCGLPSMTEGSRAVGRGSLAGAGAVGARPCLWLPSEVTTVSGDTHLCEASLRFLYFPFNSML